MKASVCICTYNGGARLPAVIACLARQTVPRDAWELVIVDNASKDDTAAAAAALLAQHGLTNGRVVPESEPGLSFARRRAANEARGEIVCFLDDDNLAEPDFIAQAIRIFDEQPKTGLAGGKVLPDWETDPGPLVRAVESFALAIVDRGEEPFTYTFVAESPVGAGMCVRRDLLRAAVNDPLLCATVTDRQGSILTSGGDTAVGIRVYQAGFDRRYEPALRLHHRLPAARMTREYLLRLHEGSGRSYAPLRQLWASTGNNRTVTLLIALKNFALWLRGLIFGSRVRANLVQSSFAPGQEPAELRGDLHAMEQRLLWGRAVGAWQVATKGRRAA